MAMNVVATEEYLIAAQAAIQDAIKNLDLYRWRMLVDDRSAVAAELVKNLRMMGYAVAGFKMEPSIGTFNDITAPHINYRIPDVDSLDDDFTGDEAEGGPLGY